MKLQPVKQCGEISTSYPLRAAHLHHQRRCLWGIPTCQRVAGPVHHRRWPSQPQHLGCGCLVFEDYTTTKSKWSKRKRINHCAQCWAGEKQAIFTREYSQWRRVGYFAGGFRWVGFLEFDIRFATLVIVRRHGILMMWLKEKNVWEKVSAFVFLFESAIFWSFDTRPVTVSRTYCYGGA